MMQQWSWDDIEKEELAEGIVRQMIWGKNIMVTRFELAPNMEIPEHEHESEQITMPQSGEVSLIFRDKEVTLRPGQMFVIPSMVPHAARSGPEGAVVQDLFSPIREDFIQGRAPYFSEDEEAGKAVAEAEQTSTDEDKQEAYAQLHGVLRGAGIKATLAQVSDVPLELLARYVYDRQLISMGKLRAILGLDKKQAKALLREWKHGDDHSESSLRKMMERQVILPGDPLPPRSEG